MKKYILFSLIAVCLAACTEQELTPVLELGAAPEITSPASGAVFTLDEAQANNQLVAFSWTAADFGFNAATTYTLEIAKVGDSFSDPTTLSTVNGLETGEVTIGQLNNIMLTKELPAGVPSTIELRVCATISEEVETLCSAPITLDVTPYQAEVNYPFLNVPGSYQDWDPANEQTVVFSRKSDNIYEGYLYMADDSTKYKFVQGGSWDVNWGDIEADGILDPGGVGNDIPINDGAGMYFLHCDLNDFTHSNVKTDWGIIGDATPTGWDEDTDMIWDEEKFALTITMDLTAGELKFRANDTWDINVGDNFGNGQLQADGENIPVAEAGNYTIDLHLSQANYGYTLTKN